MSNKPLDARTMLRSGEVDAEAAASLLAHLDRLEARSNALDRELSRAHAELHLVFEIMSEVAEAAEAEQVELLLLRRLAELLDAGAVFVDRAGVCMRVDVELGPHLALNPHTDHVRDVLAEHIEAVRVSGRAAAPRLTVEQSAELLGANAVLTPLQRPGAAVGVVIMLRPSQAPPIEPGEVLASEAVLAYGGQVLNSARTIQEMQRTAIQTVCALVNAIDAKDNYTSDHSERVGGLARLVGTAMGLPYEQLQRLEWAGLLHDVGKIGVPEQILNKPGVLTASEMSEMRRHPRTGFDMLRPVARFEPVLEAVLYHHENHDGSGYPDGRAHEQVPLEARIIHVVDIFDALTTSRPYRRAHDFDDALKLIEDDAGRVTDPLITTSFVETIRQCVAEQPHLLRADFGHFTVPVCNPISPS